VIEPQPVDIVTSVVPAQVPVLPFDKHVMKSAAKKFMTMRRELQTDRTRILSMMKVLKAVRVVARLSSRSDCAVQISEEQVKQIETSIAAAREGFSAKKLQLKQQAEILKEFHVTQRKESSFRRKHKKEKSLKKAGKKEKHAKAVKKVRKSNKQIRTKLEVVPTRKEMSERKISERKPREKGERKPREKEERKTRERAERKISDRKPREKEERKISAKKVPRLGITKRGRRAREYELPVAKEC